MLFYFDIFNNFFTLLHSLNAILKKYRLSLFFLIPMAFSEPSIYIAIYKKDFGKVLSDFVHQRAIYFRKKCEKWKIGTRFPREPE